MNYKTITNLAQTKYEGNMTIIRLESLQKVD